MYMSKGGLSKHHTYSTESVGCLRHKTSVNETFLHFSYRAYHKYLSKIVTLDDIECNDNTNLVSLS